MKRNKITLVPKLYRVSFWSTIHQNSPFWLTIRTPTKEIQFPLPLSSIANSSSSFPLNGYDDEAWVWVQIKVKWGDIMCEPTLASYLDSTILFRYSLKRSPSFHLGNKLYFSTLLSSMLSPSIRLSKQMQSLISMQLENVTLPISLTPTTLSITKAFSLPNSKIIIRFF